MAKIDSIPVGLHASGDLSGKSWAFGKLGATGVAACSSLGERADFIIGDAAQAKVAGDPVDVFLDRQVKIKVGAVAVAKGAELTPDANGLAITAVATNIVRAKANEAGNPGAVIEVLLVAPYAKA